MVNNQELPSDERKGLRNRHPLYKRISGEVVWELLKENKYDDEACGNFMDAIIAEMHKVVAVMDVLEKDTSLYLGFVATQPTCKKCLNLTQTVIAVKNIDWYKVLPPFSIGCKMQPCVFTAKEVEQLVIEGAIKVVTSIDALPVPEYALLCEQIEKV